MKTAVFKISEMIAELEKERINQNEKLNTLLGAEKKDDVAIESAQTVTQKLEAKLAVLQTYKDLTVTVRMYSARQNRLLKRAYLNQKANNKGLVTNPDSAAFMRLGIQFGVINLEPRILDMVKISEATNDGPEIWQITDAALDDDKKYDCDLELLFTEMIEEINPKNWNW